MGSRVDLNTGDDTKVVSLSEIHVMFCSFAHPLC